MEKEKLIQVLKSDAIGKGLCVPWQSKFKQGMSIEALVKMYIKGIDFCISENYPALDFLRTEFKGICEPYGVFIDESGISLHNHPDIVLNGTCSAELDYSGYSVSRIYARHESKIKVEASGNSRVTIDAFDKSHTVICAKDTSNVVISLYGTATVEILSQTPTSKIKIIHTNKETY